MRERKTGNRSIIQPQNPVKLQQEEPAKKEENTMREKGTWRQRISVFWISFIMMVCILLLCVGILAISNRISLRSLEQENLNNQQSALDKSCQRMETALYSTIAIPKAIEGTRYYDYIRSESSGYLPEKYVSVLPYIRKALQNQVYLLGNQEECILYLSGTNALCTRYRLFTTAEDCFKNYIRYSTHSPSAILSQLRTSGNILLLPMEDVEIGSRKTQCMTLIIRAVDSSIAMMMLYSREQLLSMLDMEAFPKGSHVRILRSDGVTLFEYPDSLFSEGQEDCHPIRGQLKLLDAELEVCIPKNSYNDVLSHAHRISWILIFLSLGVGLTLCVVFSRLFAQPLRMIVSKYSDSREVERNINEMNYLEQMIRQSREDSEVLRNMVASALLIRALSGGFLSREEEQKLAQRLDILKGSYRVAIAHTKSEADQAIALRYLQEQLSGGFVYEPIGSKRIGIVFSQTDTAPDQLRKCLTELQPMLGGAILCGVSSVSDHVAELHSMVRQANIALPRNENMRIYNGQNDHKKTASWLQHERFYQMLLANDIAGAREHLQLLQRDIFRGSAAQEMFFSLRFVIHSTAQELGLSFAEDETVDYDPSLMPSDNLSQLDRMLTAMWEKLQDRQRQNAITRGREVTAYVSENYSDPNLCVTVVAEYFELSEKTIHTMLRRITGMSFGDYLQQCRMQKAGVLLKESGLKVGEVGLRCGYSAESTFYRVFKQYYGITPTQFRADQSSCDTDSDATSHSDSDKKAL